MRLSTSVERDLRVEGRTLFWSLFCLLLVACGANNHVVNPVNLSAEVETKLVELRNRFFATASVTEMVNLSQEAKSIAPDAFVSHELAGELALLQARGGDANRHFLGALALSTATDADHILARIGSLSLSTDEMRSLVGILSACIERTPEGQKQLYGVHLYEYAVQPRIQRAYNSHKRP